MSELALRDLDPELGELENSSAPSLLDSAKDRSLIQDATLISDLIDKLGRVVSKADDADEALDSIESRIRTSPQQISAALREIILGKGDEKIRLEAFKLLIRYELSTSTEVANVLVDDKRAFKGLRVEAAGYLALKENSEKSKSLLVAETRDKTWGVAATTFLVDLRDATFSTLFATLATNRGLPVATREAALMGITSDAPAGLFERLRPLLKDPTLQQGSAWALCRIDPMKGLEAVMSAPATTTPPPMWRMGLISDVAHINATDAFDFLNRPIGSLEDREALIIGLWLSKKIPDEKFFKLSSNTSTFVFYTIGTLPSEESKLFLRKAISHDEVSLESSVQASISLLRQGDRTGLPSLAENLIINASIMGGSSPLFKDSTQVFAQFLHSTGGFDACIKALEEKTEEMKSSTATSPGNYAMGEMLVELFKECKAQNFTTPLRFDVPTLRRLLDANRSPVVDPEKLAVVVLPIADWNGVFDNTSQVSKLASLGYTVRVCIANSEEEAVSFVEKVAQQQRKPDLVILSGHGSASSMKLGTNDTDKDLLDLSDKDIYDRLNQCLSPETVVVLDACSTAQKVSGTNLFTYIRSGLTTLNKGNLFGASEESYRFDFIVDKNKKVTGVTFQFVKKEGRTIRQ